MAAEIYRVAARAAYGCVCVLAVFMSLSTSVNAQDGEGETNDVPVAKKPSKTERAVRLQTGIIQVDGAAVYSRPNFDSQVVTYLKQGARVEMSRRIYRGKDGFGAFYRIKLKDGRLGYVADVEVVAQLQPDFSKNESIEKANPVFDRVEDMEKNPEPIVFTQYLGGALNVVNATQKFSGQTKSSPLLMYGVKYTGPKLLNGPPVDLESVLSLSVPKYYSDFTTSARGLSWLTSVLLLMEMSQYARSHLYYGLGPMVHFRSYQIKIGAQPFDSQELTMGLGFSLGYGHRISRSVLRVEFKYFWEKYSFAGLGISYQM